MRAVVFAVALGLFPLALGLTLDRSTDVCGSWLAALWGAFGVAFLIGVVTLDPMWHRLPLRSLAMPRYPVRLTCQEKTEFDPSGGEYHTAFVFEVFNHSDHPVRVNGFGLEVAFSREGHEWRRDEQAFHYPTPYDFPVWLEPHDALHGYVDTDALAEDLYMSGEREDFVKWLPYVDVAGQGRKAVEIEHAT